MCARARAKIAGACGAKWRGAPGTPLSQARGERTIPETLERFQRFAIPGKLWVQLFLAPSGGKRSWLIKATWPQSVPRTKPALSSGTFLRQELHGEPLRLREPVPRSGEPQPEPAEGAKTRAAAAGACGIRSSGHRAPGTRVRDDPRAPSSAAAEAFNPRA